MIELPSARNQILIGLNQSILASLSMVIIAAVIGGFDDIGREVLVATNKGSARFGEALSAGVIIVLMAVVIDLLSRAAAATTGPNRTFEVKRTGLITLMILLAICAVLPFDGMVASASASFRETEAAINDSLGQFIRDHGATLDLIKNNALMYILLPLRIGLEQAVLPFTWGFTFTESHRQIYLAAVFAASIVLVLRRQTGFALFVFILGLIAARLHLPALVGGGCRCLPCCIQRLRPAACADLFCHDAGDHSLRALERRHVFGLSLHLGSGDLLAHRLPPRRAGGKIRPGVSYPATDQ